MKDTLYEYLKEASIAYGIFELANHFQEGPDVLQPILNELVAEGRLAITKKGKYAIPEALGFIPARATAQRNGSLIALPLDGGEALRIHERGKLRCLPEDTLLVHADGKGGCEIVSIPRRGKTELAAFIRVEQRETRSLPNKSRRSERGGGKKLQEAKAREIVLSAVPCDRRISRTIRLTGSPAELKNDEIALVAIDKYPEGDMPMTGHVLRILGDRSDMRTRLKAIAESHGFSTEYAPGAIAQAEAFLDAPDETQNREDLTELITFTIDGPFAKDFDDAVSLEYAGDGDAMLGVHIADVSHYVREGSLIDKEARARGTSLYLPGLTVAMLPEALCNDLCSLLPDQDRLAMSLFMRIRNGKIIDHRLTRSVIHSHARLTYDAVNRLFDGETDAVPELLHSPLLEMQKLAHQLRARRNASGSIDLDLPEAEFSLDAENQPVDIFSAPRGESERLIEDFMLAANATIAALAKNTSTPLVYRIHENPDPDRLHELEHALNMMNIPMHIGETPHPGVLQKLLEDTADRPEAYVIRRTVLRSLRRAQYSDRPEGHYALAMRDYCHFTSPIRRYPDLLVHRMMKRLLDGAATAPYELQMAELAKLCSMREQDATLAEREADDLMKARYMQDHIGEKFYGTVSGITSWGLYVTLPNTVEGLVHISSLDDYYDYNRERNILVGMSTGNIFRIGDSVRIRVESTDIDRGEINFVILSVQRRDERTAFRDETRDSLR